MRVLTSDGGDGLAVLSASTYHRSSQRVHNLTIDGTHTYHVTVGDANVLVHNATPCMPGALGARHVSKTHYERGRIRLDSENPDPGGRAGQIHIQVRGMKGKYQWNFETRRFENLPDFVVKALRKDYQNWANA